MNRFHIIDDGAVILRSRGVFRQAKVYRRGEDVYAGWGAGFIRLLANPATTAPNVSWDAIEAPDVRFATPRGRPVYGEAR
jgi:hypothetical protein